jgi:hypothetical protein
MSAVLPTYKPPTFEVLPSATSSPDSESGAMLSDSPDGPMTDLFGREVAPVPASLRREKAKGLMTLAISGHIGHPSSASAALQQSLESRLMTQLDTAGSTLFTLTWKRRRTPLGRPYLERAASVRRTSGSGCTSVPTPKTPTGGGQPERKTTGGGLRKLEDVCLGMTPHAGAGIEIVSTESMECCPESDVSILAPVPIPMAGSPARQAQLADSGVTATGGTREMKSSGQLNPEYSRWLMGLPIEFSNCVDTAMLSFRKSRRNLLRRTQAE